MTSFSSQISATFFKSSRDQQLPVGLCGLTKRNACTSSRASLFERSGKSREYIPFFLINGLSSGMQSALRMLAYNSVYPGEFKTTLEFFGQNALMALWIAGKTPVDNKSWSLEILSPYLLRIHSTIDS